MPQDSLFALLDDECTGAELDRLLERIERDPGLGQQWSRLCMARAASAGTRIAAGQPDICLGVMAALDAAPAAVDAKVVDLAAHRAGRRSRIASIWKPAVGFAAAASVGAAAVMFVQPQAGPDRAVGGEASLVSAGIGTTRAGASGIRLGQPELRTVSAADDAHAQMLREYLMDHSNAIADEGVGGTLRYARFAAHTAEYRSQTDEQP